MLPGANPLSYTLPAQMSADTAESLSNALAQLPLAIKSHITLDSSQVETLSASGAQILVSLEKTLAAAGGSMEITGQQPFFTQALGEMGLGWLVGTLVKNGE